MCIRDRLCKPHESNKAVWDIYDTYQQSDEKGWEDYKKKLQDESDILQDTLEHKEFI